MKWLNKNVSWGNGGRELREGRVLEIGIGEGVHAIQDQILCYILVKLGILFAAVASFMQETFDSSKELEQGS